MIGTIYRTLYDVNQRQGTDALFFPQAFPVLGGILSVPGILYSLMRLVEKTVHIAVNAFSHQDNIKAIRDLKDWGIILLNQVANLLSLGIVNNLFVGAAINQGATGELPPWIES